MYGYLFILIPLILAVGSWVWINSVPTFDDTWAEVTCFLMGVATLLALVFVPVSRIQTFAAIEAHIALQETVDAARADSELTIERAMLQQQVVEANRELAKAKYYHRVFGFYVPAEVRDLKPIK